MDKFGKNRQQLVETNEELNDENSNETHEEEMEYGFFEDNTDCGQPERPISKATELKKNGSTEGEKSYASIYHEKKATKNPNGYTHSEVLTMVKEGTLVPGSPPTGRNFRSDAWKNGVHFLYTKATATEEKKEVLNWYYCSKCDWIYNGVLTNGTGGVGHHYKKHLIDPPYMFDRHQLAKLLANATAFGRANGNTNESIFINILPRGDEWSEEFWENIDSSQAHAIETNEKPGNEAKKVLKRSRKLMEVGAQNVDSVNSSAADVSPSASTKRPKRDTEQSVTKNQEINKKKSDKPDNTVQSDDEGVATRPSKKGRLVRKSLGPFFRKKHASSPMPLPERDQLVEAINGIQSSSAIEVNGMEEGAISNDMSGKKKKKRTVRKLDGTSNSTPVRNYRNKLRKRSNSKSRQ